MPIGGTTSAPVHYCTGNPCPICFPQYVSPPNTWPTGPAILQQPQGCICPPTSEQTCKNPTCPRGGGQPFKVT